MPKQKLVIAEKPSVGMAIAKALGCQGKRNGYMIGCGYIVSWCIGHLAGCTLPMKRLWISSMEDSAIREGFQHLRPGSNYDGLYHAALCRAKRIGWWASTPPVFSPSCTAIPSTWAASCRPPWPCWSSGRPTAPWATPLNRRYTHER